MKNTKKLCYYFVDEAGDDTLFGKKGNIIIGKEGCSQYFCLGLLEIDHPDSLKAELDALRMELINDPYFKNVPSFQIQAKKTAIAFHAKDDVAEVRREVFALLKKRTDLRFYAIFRDKKELLSYVLQRNQNDPGYRYQPNEVYDYLVRRLFRDRLHQYDQYNITFAKRGNSDRTEALKTAISLAYHRFLRKYQLPGNENRFEIIPSLSKENTGLHAVDYFLWALQRLLEREEDRYLSLLQNSCSLIIDMDDHQKAGYGKYYNKKKPLNLEEFRMRNGKIK